MNNQDTDLLDNKVESSNIDATNFEIIVTRQALQKALSHVQAIVEKKNIIPILSNIKLVAADGKLELSTTDMEIEIKEHIAAEIFESGSITIEADTLFDIVKKLPNDESVSIRLDHSINKVVLLCSKCKFLLSYIGGAKFPSIDYGILPYSLVFSANEFIKIIDRVKFSISTDETRYNINGIYLHSVAREGKNILKAVATDGHRLSSVEISLPEDSPAIQGIIIPRKTIMELRKLIDANSGDIHIEFSENKARFNLGNIKLISKLLDGIFPEYEHFIPQNNQMVMKVDKKKFSDSIDRVSIIAFDKLKAVKLILQNNLLVLTTTGELSDSAREELVVEYDCQEIEVGFNAKYLHEIILSIEGEEVECLFDSDVDSAVLIRDVLDNGAIHVIMPMLV